MKLLYLLAANPFNIKAEDIGLPNTTQNLGDATSRIVYLLVYLIGGLSIIFIIVGGLQMVTSGGSPQRFKQGRETVLYAVVGLVVAIASFSIVSFISGRLGV